MSLLFRRLWPRGKAPQSSEVSRIDLADIRKEMLDTERSHRRHSLALLFTAIFGVIAAITTYTVDHLSEKAKKEARLIWQDEHFAQGTMKRIEERRLIQRLVTLDPRERNAIEKEIDEWAAAHGEMPITSWQEQVLFAVHVQNQVKRKIGQHSYKNAVNLLRRAHGADSSAAVTLEYARAAIKAKDYKTAQELVDKAHDLRVRMDIVWNFAGRIQQRLYVADSNHPDSLLHKSLGHFEESIKANESATAHSNKAVTHYLLGQPEDARRHFRKSLALDPSYMSAALNFAEFSLVHCDQSDNACLRGPISTLENAENYEAWHSFGRSTLLALLLRNFGAKVEAEIWRERALRQINDDSPWGDGWYNEKVDKWVADCGDNWAKSFWADIEGLKASN